MKNPKLFSISMELLYYLENRGRQICEWNTKLILC